MKISELIDNISYNFIFNKKVRIIYINILVLILITPFAYYLGYMSRQERIDKLYTKIQTQNQFSDSLIAHIDNLDNELVDFIKMKNDGDYYRYMAFKHSNINIPKNVPAEDLKLMHFLANKYEIPLKYYYRLIYKESRYNPKAISPVGAKGYMQVMPATFNGVKKRFIKKDNFIKLESLPYRQQNLVIGSFYLNDLYNRFGTWKLTFAAYNAGSSNVKKYNYTIPPFKETQYYVKFIMDI